MRVMKFGGTSVGVPANFAAAVSLVVERLPVQPLVVVSALHGVTNLLVDYARDPVARPRHSTEFVDRHLGFLLEAGLDPDLLAARLAEWNAEHARHAAELRALTGEARDRVLAFGERFSAEIFAAALRDRGHDAFAIDAGEAGLVTDDSFGGAHPLPEAPALLRRTFAEPRGVPVVTGFLGRTAGGRTTTLGRGGSDWSAAFIGAAIGADEIEIWTDTSGMLSADPRIVSRSPRRASTPTSVRRCSTRRRCSRRSSATCRCAFSTPAGRTIRARSSPRPPIPRPTRGG